MLDKEAEGLKRLVKPEKIYLKSDYAYAFSGDNENIGNLRRPSSIHVERNNKVSYSDKTDFTVDDKYHFEIGGKDKNKTDFGSKSSLYS